MIKSEVREARCMDEDIREELTRLVTEMGQDLEDPESWLKLGWKLYDESRLEDATDAYGIALELNPNYLPAYLSLGIIHGHYSGGGDNSGVGIGH